MVRSPLLWRADRTLPLKRGRRERGSVTAEAAVVLPVLVVLLTVGVGAVSAVTAQMRCVDAAREAARAAARGESSQIAMELAVEAAPDGAQVSLDSGTERIVVTVTAEVLIGADCCPRSRFVGRPSRCPSPPAR